MMDVAWCGVLSIIQYTEHVEKPVFVPVDPALGDFAVLKPVDLDARPDRALAAR